jgi:hypothetical protein
MTAVLRGLLFFFLSISAAAVSAASLPVLDKDFDCTEKSKADQYVKDFNIDLKSFGGLELCNPAIDTKKLFNDLTLIEQGQFQGTTTNVFIINNTDRDNYLQFLKDRTRGVNRRNDNPTATAYNSGGYFTMQDGWTKLSTLGRVGTIVHEARHSDGYSHRSCSHGPYSDTFSPGCDKSVVEGGAHSVEMEYYSRVALQGANFHPAYQSMARLMNIARANFVFNDSPISESETLVALTNDKVIQIKGTKRIEIPLLAAPEATDRLKRTSAGVSILTAKNEVYSLDLTATTPSLPILDTYSYFKLLTSNFPSGVTAVDTEEFDIGIKRYFFAAKDDGTIYSYIYGDGKWNHGATPLANFARFTTRAPDGTAGIFAVFTDNQYCALELNDLVCKGKLQAWPAGVDAFVLSQGRLLKLIGKQVLDAATDAVIDDFKGLQVDDLVEAPSYDVFEL